MLDLERAAPFLLLLDLRFAGGEAAVAAVVRVVVAVVVRVVVAVVVFEAVGFAAVVVVGEPGVELPGAVLLDADFGWLMRLLRFCRLLCFVVQVVRLIFGWWLG